MMIKQYAVVLQTVVFPCTLIRIMTCIKTLTQADSGATASVRPSARMAILPVSSHLTAQCY